VAKPRNKKSKLFDSESLTNWPTKSSIALTNLRKETLNPNLNFMILFITIFKTRNILTNCGKTPAWQRSALTASKTRKLFNTSPLLPQTTILCNLIQVTNVITRVLKILDFNPSFVHKLTKPRNPLLMPMLRKRKFERINEPTTSASTAVTQIIKSRTALPSKRMTIVGATIILIHRSAAGKSPSYVPSTPNPSFPNTDTVPSIFARSKIEKVPQA
jgi:hypothetical protein